MAPTVTEEMPTADSEVLRMRVELLVRMETRHPHQHPAAWARAEPAVTDGIAQPAAAAAAATTAAAAVEVPTRDPAHRAAVAAAAPPTSVASRVPRHSRVLTLETAA